MKSYSKLLILLGSLSLATACEIRKTEDGEAPSVSVQGGQVPEYEVRKTQEGELPDVDVDVGEAPEYSVKGPDVRVGTEKREVTVPTVDVDLPKDDDEYDRNRVTTDDGAD